MGIYTVGLNSALLLGPLVGGALFEKSGYSSVFAITFVLVIVDLVYQLSVVEKTGTYSRMPTNSY